jgi:hypothetical protein
LIWVLYKNVMNEDLVQSLSVLQLLSLFTCGIV